MTIQEIIAHPFIQFLYCIGVLIGIRTAFYQKTKVCFMKILVLGFIWPITIIGVLFYGFYQWYVKLDDE